MANPNDALIVDLNRALSAFAEVRMALLFGSRATGKATPASDVDIAVDAPNSLLGEIAARVSEVVHLEADVVHLQDVSIPLLRELVRDGVLVYQRVPGAGATWRSRALADLEVDGPWYDRMRDAWIAAVAKRGFGDG